MNARARYALTKSSKSCKHIKKAGVNVKSRIILVNLFSLFLMLALVAAAYAQTRVVGVEVGDKSAYKRLEAGVGAQTIQMQ